jgi:CBS domain-containing protein
MVALQWNGALRAAEPASTEPDSARSISSPLTVQRVGAREVANAVQRAADVDALARLAGAVHTLARRMLAQGVAAGQVTRIVSALNDRVVARVVAVEVARSGRSLPAFAWLALGSEGRMEQTLATDQDNGIAFAPDPGASVEGARADLLEVAARVNAALARCGFPACEGKVMAGEPAWCRTVGEWQERFAAWMDAGEPEALLGATIACDFRRVYGDRGVAAHLVAWLARTAPARGRFLALLARHALARSAPIGVLRRFVVPSSGPHAGTLDLKRDGITLFVDAARVLALAHGVAARNTAQRLREVGERAGLPRADVSAWIDALHFVQALRLRSQYELACAGRAPHNRIAPALLHALDRSVLREALGQATALQRHVARAFAADAGP